MTTTRQPTFLEWTAWFHQVAHHAGHINMCQACADVLQFLTKLDIHSAGKLVPLVGIEEVRYANTN